MNFKKVVAVIVGAIILFVVCYMVFGNRETIKHNYTFVGGSVYWEATYNVNGKEKFYERDGINLYEGEYKDKFKLFLKEQI